MCQKLKGVHSKQQLVHMYLPLHWPPSQKKKEKKTEQWAKFTISTANTVDQIQEHMEFWWMYFW